MHGDAERLLWETGLQGPGQERSVVKREDEARQAAAPSTIEQDQGLIRQSVWIAGADGEAAVWDGRSEDEAAEEDGTHAQRTRCWMLRPSEQDGEVRWISFGQGRALNDGRLEQMNA